MPTAVAGISGAVFIKCSTMDDQRIRWLQTFVQEKLPGNVNVAAEFKDAKGLLEDFLADRKKIAYLFLWKFKEGEQQPLKDHKFLLETLSREDKSEDDYEGEDNDDFVSFIPIELRERFFRFDCDKMSDYKSPLNLNIVFIARNKAGEVPIPSSYSSIEEAFNNILWAGTILDDPIEAIHKAVTTQPSEAQQLLISARRTYSNQQIKNFLKLISSYARNEKSIIQVPKAQYFYTVPFKADSEDLTDEDRSAINSLLYAWNVLLQQLVQDIEEKVFENPQGNEENAIPAEYQWWSQRAEHLQVIVQQLKMPVVLRALAILKNISPVETEKFFEKREIIEAKLEEALDNMKFLKGIKRHVEICTDATSFQAIKVTIQKVLKALRNAWMLSKYYNTDEKILYLLRQITSILLRRIKRFVKLDDLYRPKEIRDNAESSLMLLTEWESCFHRTRIAIEESEREARWEFSVQDIFEPLHHASKICADVAKVAQYLDETLICFSTPFQEATNCTDLIVATRNRIHELVATFTNLTFDVFDETVQHHWENHLSWFRREMRFIEVSTVATMEEIFSDLVSAKKIIAAVSLIKVSPHNEEIGKAILNNVSKVVQKMKREVEESSRFFHSNKHNPPQTDDLPPISRSIKWSCNIREELQAVMNQMEEGIPECKLSPSWPDAKEAFENHLKDLENYKMKQYQEWCCRVSDILAQNLTRPLLLTFPDNDNPKIRRFKVNFTAGLSHTLSEVGHLEDFGFDVPEVARNMSNQKAKLMNTADSLEELVADYNLCMESLDEPEIELLKDDIGKVHQALRAGYTRLTWNHLTIKESALDVGSKSISVFSSALKQVHLIRNELRQDIETICSGDLLREGLNASSDKSPDFTTFKKSMLSSVEVEYERLLVAAEHMTPSLVKIEEILFGTRTKKASGMAQYYQHWEDQLFKAASRMILTNLAFYADLVTSQSPKFTVKAVLSNLQVSLDPDAASVVEGLLLIVKAIIEGSKKFVRVYRESWIPVESTYSSDVAHEIVPTFYDDIIGLKSVKAKIKEIQEAVLKFMGNIHHHLNEWKNFKNLWLYSKTMTCQKFIDTKPSCIEFDEKLLFYHNVRRTLIDKDDRKDFACATLSLSPLKEAILVHVDEWISTLGNLLKETAQLRLNTIADHVNRLMTQLKPVSSLKTLNDTIQLISEIEKISLSVEIGYNDIEERCRTLEMYGVGTGKDVLSQAQSLPKSWTQLFQGAKNMTLQLSDLKERQTTKLNHKVEVFLEKVAQVLNTFRLEGGKVHELELEECFASLQRFYDEITSIKEEAEMLNQRQRLWKEPVTSFDTLKDFEIELKSNSDILNLFNSYKSHLNVLKETFFKNMDEKYRETKLETILQDSLNLTVGTEQSEILSKLRDRIQYLIDCLKEIYRLKELNLRSNHWKVLMENEMLGLEFEYDIFGQAPEYGEWKLGILLECDLDTLKKMVATMKKEVEREALIEEKINHIKELWEDYKFSFQKWTPTSDSRLFLLQITNSESCGKILEEHIDCLDEMHALDNNHHFESPINDLRRQLSQARNILSLWDEVQKDCLTLARFLLGSERDDVDESLLSDFEEDIKSFSKLMSDVVKKPLVLQCCCSATRLEALEKLNVRFIRHYETSLALINKTKKYLPRLNFIPVRQIFHILGGWEGNMEMFQFAAKRLFSQGVTGLLFGENKRTVVGLSSINGEQLLFRKEITWHKEQEIEECLARIVEQSHISVKLLCKQYFKKRIGFTDFRWSHYTEDLEQVAYLWHEIAFTNLVEEAFNQTMPLEMFKSAVRSLIDLINDTCERLSHPNNNESIRSKLLNFLNLLVSKKDKLMGFLLKRVDQANDFRWISLLKTKLNQSGSDIKIVQGRNGFQYGYEYSCLGTLPLVTDQMEVAHFQMTSSVTACKPLFLVGKPMSGKSTCLSNLVLRLGRLQCKKFLPRSPDIDVIRDILHCFCEADCWGVIDSVDSLSFDTFSAMTNFFHEISVAQQLKIKHISIGGTWTKVGFNAVLTCVSRQGMDLHKRNVPLSVLSQFRLVSIQPPDVSILLRAKCGLTSQVEVQGTQFLSSVFSLAIRHFPEMGLSEMVLASQALLRRKSMRSVDELNEACLQVVKDILQQDFNRIILPILKDRREFDKDTRINENVRIEDILSKKVSENIWTLFLVAFPTSGIPDSLTGDVNARIHYLPVNSLSNEEVFGEPDNKSGKWKEGRYKRFLIETSRASSEEQEVLFVLDWPCTLHEENQLVTLHDNLKVQGQDFEECEFPPQRILFFATPIEASKCPRLLSRVNVIKWSSEEEVTSFIYANKDISSAFQSFKELWKKHSPPNLADSKDYECHMTKQCQRILSSLASEEECSDPEIGINELVYAFLWSFCSFNLNFEQESFYKSLTELLLGTDKLISINGDYSPYSQHYDKVSRRWISSGNAMNEFLALCQHLLDKGENILLCGGPAARQFYDYVTAEVPLISDLQHRDSPTESSSQEGQSILGISNVDRYSSRDLLSFIPQKKSLSGETSKHRSVIGFSVKGNKWQFGKIYRFFNIFKLKEVSESFYFSMAETKKINPLDLRASRIMKSLLKKLKDIDEVDIENDLIFIRKNALSILNESFQRSSFQEPLDTIAFALYFPLYSTRSRKVMAKLLEQNSVPLEHIYENSSFETFPPVLREAADEVDYCLKSNRCSIITVMGKDHVGKRAVSELVCKERDMKTKLISSEQSEWKSCQTLAVFLETTSDIESLISKIESAIKNGIVEKILLIVSTSHYCKEELERILTKIIPVSVIVGMRDWTEVDLMRTLIDDHIPMDMASFVSKVHFTIGSLSQKYQSFPEPSHAYFQLACSLANRHRIISLSEQSERIKWLEVNLKKADEFEESVENLKTYLDMTVKQVVDLEQEGFSSEAEISNLEIQIETEEETALQIKEQMSEVKAQLDILESDEATFVAKMTAKFEHAKDSLSDLKEDKVEEFFSLIKERARDYRTFATVLSSLADVFIPANGETVPALTLFNPGAFPELTKKLISLDLDFLDYPLHVLEYLRLSSGSLSLLEEQRKGCYVLGVLLDLIEGFLEFQQSREEIMELRVKKSECALLLTNLSEDYNNSLEKGQEARSSLEDFKKSRAELADGILRRKSEIERLEKLISKSVLVQNAIKEQVENWRKEIDSYTKNKASVSQGLTFSVVSSLYLSIIPESRRSETVDLILEATSFIPPDDMMKRLKPIWTPWRKDNLMRKNEIPGWKEKLAPKMFFAYDPKDIIDLQFSPDTLVKKLNILSRNDVKVLYKILNEQSDAIIVISICHAAWKFETIEMVEHSPERGNQVFFMVKSLNETLPSKGLFLNLDTTPFECAKIYEAFFKDAKHQYDPNEKTELTGKLREAENELSCKLMEISVNFSSLDADPDILKNISERITELKAKVQSCGQMTEDEKELTPEFLDIGAILCGCVALSSTTKTETVLISVVHFITVTKTILSMNGLDLEKASEVIFNHFAMRFPEEDTITLKFFVAVYQDVLRQKLDVSDLATLISLENFPVPTNGSSTCDLSKPTWCPQASWEIITRQGPVRGTYIWSTLMENEDQWKKWFIQSDLSVLKTSHETKWIDFLLAVCLKRDVAINIVQLFLSQHFQSISHWDTKYVNLDNLSDFVQCTLLLSDQCYEDPGAEIAAFGQQVDLAESKLKFYAISSKTTADDLRSLLVTGGLRGQWLVLYNLTNMSLMVIQKYLEETANVHTELRIWLTSQTDHMPSRLANFTFLQRCNVVRFQPERTVDVNKRKDSDETAAMPFKNLLIHYCDVLHERYTTLKNCQALYLHSETFFPMNRIRRLILSNVDQLLPVVKDNRLVNPRHVHQVLDFMINFVFGSYIHSDDVWIMSVDFQEILQVIIEYFEGKVGLDHDPTNFIMMKGEHFDRRVTQLSIKLAKCLVGPSIEYDSSLDKLPFKLTFSIRGKAPEEGDFSVLAQAFIVNSASMLHQIPTTSDVSLDVARTLSIMHKQNCFDLRLFDNPDILFHALTMKGGYSLDEIELLLTALPSTSSKVMHSSTDVAIVGLSIMGGQWIADKNGVMANDRDHGTSETNLTQPLRVVQVKKLQLSRLKFVEIPVFHDGKQLCHVRMRFLDDDCLMARNIRLIIRQT